MAKKTISNSFIVNTIDDPVSLSALYTATVNSQGTATSTIHETWQTGDVYMRTKSSEDVSWSAWNKIVGENGKETDYSFAISASPTLVNDALPQDLQGITWADAPMQVTSAKPYLWAKVQKKDGSGSVTSTNYIRMTGENGADGVTYYIKPNITQVTIPSGSSSVTAAIYGYLYKRVGDGAETVASSGYGAMYLRTGTTYSPVTAAAGVLGVMYAPTVANTVNAVIIYVFPSSYGSSSSDTNPEGQSYYAKYEIPVIKDGTNGANGTNGTDGQNAVQYRLNCSVNEAKYTVDPAGNATFNPATYTLAVIKSDGSTQTSYTNESNLPSGVTVKYVWPGESEDSQSLGTLYADDEATDSGDIVSKIEYRLYVSSVLVDTHVVKFTREIARLIVPAGTYEDKEYTRTDSTTPLVLESTNNKYYFLSKDTNKVVSGGTTTYTAPTTSGQTVWTEASYFEMVLTKLLFAESAMLGSLAIYGKYMLSICGRVYYKPSSLSTWSFQDIDNYRDKTWHGQPGYYYFAGTTNFTVNNTSYNDDYGTGGVRFEPKYWVNMETGLCHMGDAEVDGYLRAKALYLNYEDVTTSNQSLSSPIPNIIFLKIPASGNGTKTITLPYPDGAVGQKIEFYGPGKDSSYMPVYIRTQSGYFATYTGGNVPSDWNYGLILFNAGNATNTDQARLIVYCDGHRWIILECKNVYTSNSSSGRLDL